MTLALPKIGYLPKPEKPYRPSSQNGSKPLGRYFDAHSYTDLEEI